jgi:transglutaminase-like putative cysteine protease
MSNAASYRISHRTHYRYGAAVAICQNQLRMIPHSVDSPCLSMVCHNVQTKITPEPTFIDNHFDYFGNLVTSFSIELLHRELTVSVVSEVTVSRKQDVMKLDSPPWETVGRRISSGENPQWLSAQEYLHDSPRIRRDESFAKYASPSFTPGQPVLQATLDLTKRIHQDFRYDSGATDVNTTTEDAFGLKAGVCQDFAHIQIACLRSIGIPARYVSGYLRTVPPEGQPRLVGADESHAWVSVYTGEKWGWVSFDPTNACVAEINHIPICTGRDYSEVSPMRGVVIGGGTTELSVSVDVAPIAVTNQ